MEGIYLAAWKNRRIVGILPLLVCPAFPRGIRLITLPFCGVHGSLCADSPEIEAALVSAAWEILQQRCGLYLELREAEAKKLEKVLVNDLFASYRLNFKGDPDAVWSEQVDSKARNQVRKAEKSGLTWKIGAEEFLRPFYEIYCETMRDLGSPPHSFRFFKEMIRCFESNTFIAMVLLNKNPVAAMWIVGDRHSVVDPWAGSKREYRDLCPNNLLYWQSIRWAIEGGYRVFDLGRSMRGSGHARFKLQWGSTERPAYYYYLLNKAHKPPNLNPENKVVQTLAHLWRFLPLRMTQWIGPWMVHRVS